MALPLLAPAVKAIDADVFPGVATKDVGAAGVVAGVTALDGSDSGPYPNAFRALLVNVYGVPFVNPVTTIGEPLPVAVVICVAPEYAVAV